MRKIIICFDGTCNDPKDGMSVTTPGFEGLRSHQNVSNIVKLHLMFGGNLLNDQSRSTIGSQTSFYYKGVGTYGDILRRLYNAGFAPADSDVGKIIRNAIKDLTEHYQPGDEVFVFGFSRGAAIGRKFCSVLPMYFKAFGLEYEPEVRFLGVFDTVAAINRPNLYKKGRRPASDVLFENRTIAPCIKEALHIVALDDKRVPFYPTLMNRESKVTEIWFPGVHGNVGGGNKSDGLSDLALDFMLQELERRGFGLDILQPKGIDYQNIPGNPTLNDMGKPVLKVDRRNLEIQPDPACENQSLAQQTKLINLYGVNDRQLRVNVDDVVSHEPSLVHESVIERLKLVESYHPNSMSRAKLTHPVTQKPLSYRIWQKPDRDNILIPTSTSPSQPPIGPEIRHTYNHYKSGQLVSPSPLSVGASKLVEVFARRLYSDSGILIKPGESYEISVFPDQVWFDANITCGPDGWRAEDKIRLHKRWLIKASERFRRMPKLDWFALVGCIGHSDKHAFPAHSDNTPLPYTPTLAGQLCFFANDLLRLYKNNHGSIILNIRRLT